MNDRSEAAKAQSCCLAFLNFSFFGNSKIMPDLQPSRRAACGDVESAHGSDTSSSSMYETFYYREEHNQSQLAYITLKTEKKKKGLARKGLGLLLYKFRRGFFEAALYVQALTVLSSAFLTRAVAFYGLRYGIFLSYAVVATAGSSAAPQLAAAWNVGVFSGMAALSILPNWGWFTLLAVSASALWVIFVRFNLLVGFGGRLGTAVFICENFVIAVIVAPSKAVPWSVFGTSQRTYALLLSWQQALCVLISAPVSAVLSFKSRLLGHSMENPVTGANVTALLLMLIVTSAAESGSNGTPWLWMNEVLQGIAIGSFVGMAATDRLPGGTIDFTLAALLSAGFLILFTPFFEGFVIMGFEAFLGCLVVHWGRKIAIKCSKHHRLKEEAHHDKKIKSKKGVL